MGDSGAEHGDLTAYMLYVQTWHVQNESAPW